MSQPPAYNRTKDFTEDFGSETDHSALNAELDKASNSINDIRTNLAILQADDGKLNPDVVTTDSISADVRDDLSAGILAAVGGSVADAAALASKNSASNAAASALTSKNIVVAAAAAAAVSASQASAANVDNYPAIRPTLLLDFANSKRVDPRITFTRASTATYTDAFGVMRTAAVNEPRIDYDPDTGECKGFLIEGAATNLLLYSEQFTNAYWNKYRSSITANSVIAPDSTMTADTVIEDTTAANSHGIQLASFTAAASTQYTVSMFVKAAGRANIRIAFNSQDDWGARTGSNSNFDLISGTVRANTGTCVGAIQSLGSGWFRVSATDSSVAAPTGTQSVLFSLITTAWNATYDGDGVSGMHIWGVQLEVGGLSSYIPTEASQVTRAADNAVMTGANFSSWYRQDEGTFVVGANLARASLTNNLSMLLQTSDGTTQSRHEIYANVSAGVITNLAMAGGVSQENLNVGAFTFGQSFKTAAGYKLDNYAGCTNGGTVATDTSATVPTVSELRIGYATTPGEWNGHIQRIAYYPRRLANAQLQAVTT